MDQVYENISKASFRIRTHPLPQVVLTVSKCEAKPFRAEGAGKSESKLFLRINHNCLRPTSLNFLHEVTRATWAITSGLAIPERD